MPSKRSSLIGGPFRQTGCREFTLTSYVKSPNQKISLRIRSDGAWYQHDIMEYCVKEGYEFSISADVSYGLKRFILAIPEGDWTPLHHMTKNGKEKTDKEVASLRFTTASFAQAEIKERIQNYRYIVTRTPRSQIDLIDGSYH